jgi:hypothetical protein
MKSDLMPRFSLGLQRPGKLVYVNSVPWVRIPPRPLPRNDLEKEKALFDSGVQLDLVHFWSTVNPRTRKSSKNLALGIVTANALAAIVYVTLAILGHGPLVHLRPNPSLLAPAFWLLALSLIIDAAWGTAMLAIQRWRRWDLYAFVWIGWLLAIFIGSGLASI